MKFPTPQTGAPKVDAAFKSLDAYLRHLTTDNFKGAVISGQTNSTADTKQTFKHGLKGAPSAWFPVYGDVYIPNNGFGTDTVDVRSRLGSHSFKIVVFL